MIGDLAAGGTPSNLGKIGDTGPFPFFSLGLIFLFNNQVTIQVNIQLNIQAITVTQVITKSYSRSQSSSPSPGRLPWSGATYESPYSSRDDSRRRYEKGSRPQTTSPSPWHPSPLQLIPASYNHMVHPVANLLGDSTDNNGSSNPFPLGIDMS